MAEIRLLNIWVLLAWNVFLASSLLGKSTDDELNCKSDKYQARTLQLLHEETIANSLT